MSDIDDAIGDVARAVAAASVQPALQRSSLRADVAETIIRRHLQPLLERKDADIRRAIQQRGSCPCRWTTPCSPDCTCVKSFSSVGCSRCNSYGSEDQRREMAEHLAKLIDGGNVLLAELEQARRERDEAREALRRITTLPAGTSPMWESVKECAIEDCERCHDRNEIALAALTAVGEKREGT